MKKEKFDKVVGALVNDAVYNSSEDIALSLREHVQNGTFDGEIVIFPNKSKLGFYGHIIPHLWAIAAVYNVFMSFEVKNGTVICELV